MTTSELIQAFFERSNALQNYWTLYVVVIGGLLAFASMRKQPDIVTTALVSILFIMFAYKNLGAIEDVSIQRIAILDAFKQQAAPVTDTMPATQTKTLQLIQPTMITPDLHGIRHFHIVSDVLTVAALWAMELRRRRAAKAGHHA